MDFLVDDVWFNSVFVICFYCLLLSSSSLLRTYNIIINIVTKNTQRLWFSISETQRIHSSVYSDVSFFHQTINFFQSASSPSQSKQTAGQINRRRRRWDALDWSFLEQKLLLSPVDPVRHEGAMLVFRERRLASHRPRRFVSDVCLLW